MNAARVRELLRRGAAPDSIYPDGWMDPRRNAVNLNAVELVRRPGGWTVLSAGQTFEVSHHRGYDND